MNRNRYRCPACRTRRPAFTLLLKHCRDKGHQVCTCGGYHHVHRPMSPLCVQNPMSDVRIAQREGVTGAALEEVEMYCVWENPGVRSLFGEIEMLAERLMAMVEAYRCSGGRDDHHARKEQLRIEFERVEGDLEQLTDAVRADWCRLVTTYVAPLDTVADRAIAHLRSLPPGSEMGSADLAAAVGTDSDGFATCMKLARNAGVVSARAVRRRLRWSLGINGAIGALPRVLPSAPGPRPRYKA